MFVVYNLVQLNYEIHLVSHYIRNINTTQQVYYVAMKIAMGSKGDVRENTRYF